jgi:hypothetical protein
MKDIPIEELASINAEIHVAADRIGCKHVNITRQIWPGGKTSGLPEEAARFVEFSWFRAAVINGRAIFEHADPQAYTEVLVRYGLEDGLISQPAQQAVESKPDEPAMAAVLIPREKVDVTAEVLRATRLEMERQARAEGLTVGELLDWKFRPRS